MKLWAITVAVIWITAFAMVIATSDKPNHHHCHHHYRLPSP